MREKKQIFVVNGTLTMSGFATVENAMLRWRGNWIQRMAVIFFATHATKNTLLIKQALNSKKPEINTKNYEFLVHKPAQKDQKMANGLPKGESESWITKIKFMTGQ